MGSRCPIYKIHHAQWFCAPVAHAACHNVSADCCWVVFFKKRKQAQLFLAWAVVLWSVVLAFSQSVSAVVGKGEFCAGRIFMSVFPLNLASAVARSYLL